MAFVGVPTAESSSFQLRLALNDKEDRIAFRPGDGLLQQLLPTDGISLPLDAAITWSPYGGWKFVGLGELARGRGRAAGDGAVVRDAVASRDHGGHAAEPEAGSDHAARAAPRGHDHGDPDDADRQERRRAGHGGRERHPVAQHQGRAPDVHGRRPGVAHPDRRGRRGRRESDRPHAAERRGRIGQRAIDLGRGIPSAHRGR